MAAPRDPGSGGLRRTDEQRLEHFARRFDEIAAEPAIGQTWSWNIHFDGTEATTTYQEPRRQDYRSLLIDVRKLDARREDLFLVGILDLLDARVQDPTYRTGLSEARAHYDECQGPGAFHFKDDQGAMTMREAFELWVYGEHLHDDFDKEQRWQRAGLGQAFIRQNAIEYMKMLIGVANYCRVVIEKDPGLQSIKTPTRLASPG